MLLLPREPAPEQRGGHVDGQQPEPGVGHPVPGGDQGRGGGGRRSGRREKGKAGQSRDAPTDVLEARQCSSGSAVQTPKSKGSAV